MMNQKMVVGVKNTKDLVSTCREAHRLVGTNKQRIILKCNKGYGRERRGFHGHRQGEATHQTRAKKRYLEVRAKLSLKRQIGVWKNKRGP